MGIRSTQLLIKKQSQQIPLESTPSSGKGYINNFYMNCIYSNILPLKVSISLVSGS